jgi:hypothetical protein
MSACEVEVDARMKSNPTEFVESPMQLTQLDAELGNVVLKLTKIPSVAHC